MESVSQYDWRKLEAAAEHPVWVRDNEELARLCTYWQTLPMVALDTEFQRVDTFYPIPGLIQLADDRQCYLIDPLSIEDFSPLAALFANESVLKVLHAATEDIELFHKSLGQLPRPVYDTQMAAAFVGWGFSMGLQRMLQHALNVEMEKDETTSDWLQRPLTPGQERYAALDVAYLPTICKMQQEVLQRKGIAEWVIQEGEGLLHQSIDTDPEGLSYYRRFTQMWRLSEEKLAGLRDLTAWRERTCRERDVPRNRILRNQALLDIVDRWPRSVSELSRVPELKRRAIRVDGPVILEILQAAAQSASDNPPLRIEKPLHFGWNQHLKKLKAMVRERAEELDIAPEVLLRKKELDALIRTGCDTGNYRLPDEMVPWRREVIGEKLLAELNKIGIAKQ